MPAELRYADVNGARLGYEVHGEAPGRPATVFVHGYSGRSTGDGYGELVDALARVFTVYSLDLRGHGASVSEVQGFSMTAAADDVAAFSRSLGLTGALYIGHSFGAFTGMYCEVRNPGTFTALALLNTASAEGGRHTPPENAELLIEHGSNPDFMRLALAAMYVRGPVPETHVQAATSLNKRVHELYFAEYPDRIIIDEVRGLTLPVLMLNGARDVVVPLTTQHATALALANCKEVVLTTEGHMLPIEAPAFAAREIIAFWQNDVCGDVFPVAQLEGGAQASRSVPA